MLYLYCIIEPAFSLFEHKYWRQEIVVVTIYQQELVLLAQFCTSDPSFLAQNRRKCLNMIAASLHDQSILVYAGSFKTGSSR